MIIRFRSPVGMHRVSCEAGERFGDVLARLEAVLREAGVSAEGMAVGREANGQDKVDCGSIVGQDVGTLYKHGDIVYVHYTEAKDTATSVDTASGGVNASGSGQSVQIKGSMQELDVDKTLEKVEGLIPRSRTNLCKHGDKGMCEYCSPLPPWDAGYHNENNIKHISFHSYLKKLNEHTNKSSSGSSYIAPLSQPDFRIDRHCRNGHEPWPKGICSKCQPSAITLQQQEFRMVDHVEFQNSELINQFIEFWRASGTQRFAYLYGKYEEYEATPLGIKASVHAIYEPPQHDEPDGLTMDMEQVTQEMAQVDQLASEMGLLRVGLIFSDLTDAGNGDGTVLCKRHKDSFFLSSLETIMAAKHQSRHPNVSKFSEQGIFSSKFVTCVVSGNLQSEIDISCYQVSIDAEALVAADMIGGSTHPSMAYINETTNDRYVPEIFYMKKNEYGLTIKENAKPAFPVDYLIVSLTHGFPKEDAQDKKIFKSTTGFPWSNRQAMGYSQDYHELKRYLYSAATNGNFNDLHDKLANFHLLVYIHSLQILSAEEWALLVAGATTTDYQEPLYKLSASPGWQTLVMILTEAS
ncbi:Nuclear protein localization protein 4 [Nakaseomyces bracarensis]|uniref:Nuclear protein localization protein 4 n=1 Tax=Nakaseomyces bracarensis TaxID=273131 RepID=A0ABR4P157_9SACH